MSSPTLDTDFAFDTTIPDAHQEEEPEAVPLPTILTREELQDRQMHYNTLQMADMRKLLEAHIANSTPPPQAPLPPPPPYYPAPLQPNLNLPPPPQFSGLVPSELGSFRIKVSQFIYGNHNTYTTAASQVMCAGALLIGPAAQWYESLVDLTTMQLPTHYTLPIFFHELADFFGGGVTLDSRERSLIGLRQVGTVAELAISFQNITNTFSPRWADHPLIYTFS